MEILAIPLVAIVALVVIGSPIWFSIKASPLGPMGYRWGTFIAAQCIFGFVVLLARTLSDLAGSNRESASFFAFFALVVGVIAVGLLRRKRWGVVFFLCAQAGLILLPVLLLPQDDLPPLSE